MRNNSIVINTHPLYHTPMQRLVYSDTQGDKVANVASWHWEDGVLVVITDKGERIERAGRVMTSWGRPKYILAEVFDLFMGMATIVEDQE